MELIGNIFFFEWEVALITWLQAHLGAVGTAVASAVSSLGEELVCVAVLGFLYWCYDKEFGRFVGLNMLVGVVLNPMIKNLAIRLRPYHAHEEIFCLKPVDGSADIYDVSAQGYSFPSGHSTPPSRLRTPYGCCSTSSPSRAAARTIPTATGASCSATP